MKLQGYHVLAASHGLHALQVLSQQRPDVIITDIAMPRMDGASMCSLLKSDLVTDDIPIIVCSGVSRFASRACEASSCFLQKPVDFDALDRMIRVALQSRPKDH
jgi:CheY-like chemotaxis protein